MSIIYSLLAMQLYITLIAAVLSVNVTQYGTQEARVDLGVTCLSRGKSVARKWWVKSANFHSLITFSRRIVYQHSELHFSFVSEPVGLTYTRRVKKGKRSPCSITERRFPELIPVLGSQPAGDVSHKPGGRLPLLSAKPAVTLAALKKAATSFAAW